MDTIPTRKEWTKMRDAAGGSSGMVKNVSVGRLLENYDNATKTYRGNSPVGLMLGRVRPLGDIDKGLRAYRAAMPKDKTKLIAVIDQIRALIAVQVSDGQKLANPVHRVTSHLGEVITKSKAIATGGDNDEFYEMWKVHVLEVGYGFDALMKVDPALAPLRQAWQPFSKGGTWSEPLKIRTAATKLNFAALKMRRELQNRKVTA